MGGNPSPTLPQMPKLNTEFFQKYFKLGWLITLIVLAIALTAIAKNYNGRAQASGSLGDRSSISATLSDIEIISPLPNAVVSLPIVISGTAKSEWFNDGTFPIELYDAQNNLLASSFAIADSAPLDGGVANFTGIFENVDTDPATSIGRVVLYKFKLQNNPAAGEIASIGIRFAGISSGVGTNKKILRTNSTSSATNTKSSTVKSTTSTTTTKSSDGTLNAVSGSTTTSTAGPDSCRDGEDNDGDKKIDWQDANCHTDGNAGNVASYQGSLSESPTGNTATSNMNTQNTTTSGTTGTSSTSSTSTNTSTKSGTGVNSYDTLVGNGTTTNSSGTTTTKSNIDTKGCNRDIWGSACDQ